MSDALVRCPDCSHDVRVDASGVFFAHDVDGLEPNGPGYFNGQNREGAGHRRCWPVLRVSATESRPGRKGHNPDANPARVEIKCSDVEKDAAKAKALALGLDLSEWTRRLWDNA